MKDAKLIDISGRKAENLKLRINELETSNKNKNIRQFCE
jgi:hypothetical protein